MAFSAGSSDADTPDKASVTTTAAVEGKGKVNGATATSAGNETGCFRCAMVAPNTKGGGMGGFMAIFRSARQAVICRSKRSE